MQVENGNVGFSQMSTYQLKFQGILKNVKMVFGKRGTGHIQERNLFGKNNDINGEKFSIM